MRPSASMPGSTSRSPIELIQALLTGKSDKFDSRTLFWFALSLLFSIGFASLALRQAFSSRYVLQDDARHHIFWMARFTDPDLFPHDLIADYFRSVAPDGYTLLYRGAAGVGIDPFLFSKLLPMLLGLITTGFCFGVSMRLLRVPAAAFISSLVLNQSLWMRNGLVSATPRAFICPLFLAFLYFVLRGSMLSTAIVVALMGLFFPPILFIGLGVLFLRLLRLDKGRVGFSRERRDYTLCATALAIAVAVMLPYAFKTSGFGPVVTAAEAKEMPEFLPGGRMVVFRQGFWAYWFTASHTGMFSSGVFYPALMSLGLLLPILLVLKKRFPLLEQLSRDAALFPRVIAASLFMFLAANALLFRLYLPSRFTVNSFRIVLAVSAGISAVVMLDAVFRVAKQRALVILTPAAVLAAALVLPFVKGPIVDTRYKTGENPRLYEFLAGQPKDSLVASLSADGENLPIFARRSILVGREIALPFHKRYYSQIRQRMSDLVSAQYSPDPAELQTFVQKYGVTHLLLDRNAFTPEYVSHEKWITRFQPATREKLEAGLRPALSIYMDDCKALETKRLVLVSTDCIRRALVSPQAR